MRISSTNALPAFSSSSFPVSWCFPSCTIWYSVRYPSFGSHFTTIQSLRIGLSKPPNPGTVSSLASLASSSPSCPSCLASSWWFCSCSLVMRTWMTGKNLATTRRPRRINLIWIHNSLASTIMKQRTTCWRQVIIGLTRCCREQSTTSFGRTQRFQLEWSHRISEADFKTLFYFKQVEGRRICRIIQ